MKDERDACDVVLSEFANIGNGHVAGIGMERSAYEMYATLFLLNLQVSEVAREVG
jgi:hypothetical protein